jgi:hypothetical protein
MVNSRRIRWTGYIARMGRREMLIGYWWEIRRRQSISKTKTEMANNSMDRTDLA